MKIVAALTGSVFALMAVSSATAAPIDDAAAYIYERCLESFGKSGSLDAEFAGTRFVPVAYAPAEGFGAKNAFAHPALGETRVWETREDYGESTQLGCTMMIDGGDGNRQFDGISRELGDEIGIKYVKQLRQQLGDYNALTVEGMRNSLKLGDATLSHVLTRGIPGKPDTGYILSIFLSKPK